MQRKFSQTRRNAPRRCSRTWFSETSFLPFTGYNLKNHKQAEEEFFRSVHHLCEMYGLAEPDVARLPFPENIQNAHNEISKALEISHSLSCNIMQDSKRMATLATVKCYDAGHNLYYIPVNALAKIGEDTVLKPLYELLELLFTYLKQVTGIDFYRDKYAYIRSVYDMLEEWMRKDNDGECYDDLLAEMEVMKSFGDYLLRKLKLPFSKPAFEDCIIRFRQSKNSCAHLLELAMDFAKLMADYPNRTVYSSIPKDFYDWQENGTIEIGHYIGFYWGGSEKLNEQFFDCVDNDLQERGEQVEPLALQWFDSPQEMQTFNFDYEARLFPLLIELNNFLYHYDHVNEHHQ
jgi:hypothetical protein